MACGTPVIALGTSAVKELISSDNGIVLESYFCEDYLAAIKKIESKNLTRNRIRSTVEKYSNEKMLDKIMRLYVE